MRERFWPWLIARTAVAAILIGWALSYLWPASGDKEFQRAIEAIKKVDSVEYAWVSDSPTVRREMTGQLICSRNAYHTIDHFAGPDIAEHRDETLTTGTVTYKRLGDDPWQKSKWVESAQPICAAIGSGMDNHVFPMLAEMLERGVIQAQEKKKVGGVRCRQWKVTMRTASGTEQYKVCLGVDDHLPREIEFPGGGIRYLYSNYGNVEEIRAPVDVQEPEPTPTPYQYDRYER